MPAYTWTPGETITAAKLNTLETEAYKVANLLASNSSTSQSSTTSTSYVDGAASVTFTAPSSTVYVQVSGGGLGNFGGSSIQNQRVLVGVNVNNVDYTITHLEYQTYPTAVPFCGGVLVTGLTPNTSYTAKIRFATSAATAQFHINYNARSSQQITVWSISK